MRPRKYPYLAFVILILAFAGIGEVNALSATGGTITTSGNYTTHTFTSSGTFNVTGSGNVRYLVVAGGGGGGGSAPVGADSGGGGGGGGVLTNSNYDFSVTSQSYAITIGNGGAGGVGYSSSGFGASGSDSVFSTFTAIGGGGGGSQQGAATNGGSGGGSAGETWNPGTGTSGQGYSGGNGGAGPAYAGGGGGGAGTAGLSANTTVGGSGGAGILSSISGSAIYYAGGGGGGTWSGTRGQGGLGGGGAGATETPISAASGTANSGGGGGGASGIAGSNTAGSGGSGIVIIGYLLDIAPKVSPDFPANGATIISTSAILNWTPSNFISNPTCNVTRNGSTIFSGTCPNDQICAITNNTSEGSYSWNVTCYFESETATSPTRNFTINAPIQISFVPPTPNNNQTINLASAIIKVSVNKNVSSCTLMNTLSFPGNLSGDGSDGAFTVTGVNTVVNTYAYLTGNELAGDNVISVNNAAGFSVGNELLVIQMQDYLGGTAGKYEFRKIASINGNSLTLDNSLNNSYYSGTFNTINSRVAQIVRIPQYTTVTVQSGASIVPDVWNGYRGGIVAFRASGEVAIIGSIDATGKGFGGGAGRIILTGNQGESYYGLGVSGISPNGGGGSGGRYCNEPAGGSGASYGSSGDNGKLDANCGTCGTSTPGSTYGNTALSIIYLGSGGGGGVRWSEGYGNLAPGGNGGGIIMVFANSINVSGSIASKGVIGTDSGHDYSSNGGSGSGGSIYLSAGSIITGNSVDASGGPAQTGTAGNGDGGYGGAGRIRLDYNNVLGTTSPSYYGGNYTPSVSLTSPVYLMLNYSMSISNADSSTWADYFLTNLSNGSYNYYVTCTNGVASNNSETRNLIVNATESQDLAPPTATFSSPPSGTQTPIQAQTFSCNATDSVGLSNITLKIWNSSNSLIYSNSSAISGTSNSSSWNYAFSQKGNFTWNCLATDNSSNSAYANSNSTLTIQKYALLQIIYPADGSGISRGKDDVEDMYYRVSNNMSILARVIDNETGAGISGANCGLSINNAAKWGATANSTGFCAFSYDKSNDQFGANAISINYSGMPSDYYSSSAVNSTYVLENWSMAVDINNYRSNGTYYYYVGDVALVSIAIRKDGVLTDVNGISVLMTNQGDQALATILFTDFTKISTGQYKAEVVIPQTNWMRWKAVVMSSFSGQDSNATSNLHTDVNVQAPALSQLNISMMGANNSPLANAQVNIYRVGSLGSYSIFNQTFNSSTQSVQKSIIQNDSNYNVVIATPDNYSISLQNINISAGLNFQTQQSNFTDAKPNQTRYVSSVLASNATGFSISTLTFVKTFEPTSICSCQNWSFNSSSCTGAWVCNSTSAYDYSSNSTHFWFNVTHFTGYALGQSDNENLTIWDETDSGMPYGNQMKYISQNIRFLANYSNSTSEPITGADCSIWFLDSGWVSMAWNSTSLYEYTRSFNSGGTFDWNVTCNKTGQTTLNATDTVLVNSTIAVVLNSPADALIQRGSTVIFNWTPYGFPGDPSCNVTRNGTMIHISSCTNNEPCVYSNTTANGYYIWNITCNSGATTRESSTRSLTVNTIYRSSSAEGTLNMNITEISSISLPQNTISFGTVEITQTYDSHPSQFFVIKNDGNTVVDIEVNATNPFLSSSCSSLPCTAYQVKVGANETAPYPSCFGNPTKESYTNMFGSSSGLLINDFNFVDNDDSANIYIKYVVPNDEPPGSKSSTVTFWAKSAGSYACN